MNTGQLLMALGAMVLLSFLVLRVNGNQLSTEDNMQNTKYGLLAISLANSVIEDANKRAFDNATIDNSVSTASGLTLPSKLGPESGEVYETFDDIDDYNNYTRLDSTMPSAAFNIKCSVCYVNPTTPDVAATVQTFHKKITVFVSSKAMRDTVKISQIFSYWNYL